MSNTFYYNTNFDGIGDQSKEWWIEFIKKQIPAIMNDTDAEAHFQRGLANGVVINRNALTASEIILDDETILVMRHFSKGSTSDIHKLMEIASVSKDELNVIMNLLCGLGYIGNIGN